MPESSTSPPLHLPDLHIEGFRGISSLRVKRLGRATLVAGQNGVGKTTVLDAVRTFAARGGEDTLRRMLTERSELLPPHYDEEDGPPSPDATALFHGRCSRDARIAIGPSDPGEQVVIREKDLTEEYASSVGPLLPDEIVYDSVRVLKVCFRSESGVLPVLASSGQSRMVTSGQSDRELVLRAIRAAAWPATIKLLRVGPGPLSEDDMADFWSTIALTDQEMAAVTGLRQITGERVVRVAPIGAGHPIMKVRIEGLPRPVPLQSLGDGAVRWFSVAIALANCRDGFLTIDEAENGIHHTAQKDFWHMVLTTAQENNVQVFATTHSFDCVRGFVQAADESEGIDAALVRLDVRDGQHVAVEYPEKVATVAAEQGIEVR